MASLTDYLSLDPDQTFEPAPGRLSALWRHQGHDPHAPSLMLMAHTDVVPANPEQWTHPPFDGVRADGFIWGRGAVDMLNVTAAMAAVFGRIADGRIPAPAGDVIYLAVADEEAAGALGADWITEHHWEDVACDYLLTEVGAPALPSTDGVAIPVTVAEKGPQWKRLTAGGIAGHGSQPYGSRNALVPVARAMAGLADSPTDAVITDEWRAFVEAWNPSAGLRASLLDPEGLETAIDRLHEDDPGLAKWVHACTHLTITPTVLRAGVKANVVPDTAEAQLDVRALPGQDGAAVARHLQDLVGTEVDVAPIASTEANSSPAAGPLWDAIGSAVREIDPGARLVPTMIPVATDARFWRSHGTVAYGVGHYDGSLGFGDFLGMFHGPDERVSEASLGMTADLFAGIVTRFWD